MENATHTRTNFPHRTNSGWAISPNICTTTFGTPCSSNLNKPSLRPFQFVGLEDAPQQLPCQSPWLLYRCGSGSCPGGWTFQFDPAHLAKSVSIRLVQGYRIGLPARTDVRFLMSKWNILSSCSVANKGTQYSSPGLYPPLQWTRSGALGPR